MPPKDLLQQAKKALNITVPIYRADVDEKTGAVTFYLYGHREPVTWSPEPEPKPKRTRSPASSAGRRRRTTKQKPADS
jgi:hypothetical protein